MLSIDLFCGLIQWLVLEIKVFCVQTHSMLCCFSGWWRNVSYYIPYLKVNEYIYFYLPLTYCTENAVLELYR